MTSPEEKPEAFLQGHIALDPLVEKPLYHVMGEQCSVVLRIILQAAQTDDRFWPIRIRPLMLLLKQRQQWGKHKPEILPQDGSNDNKADVGSQQQYHTTINSPGVAILVISNP